MPKVEEVVTLGSGLGDLALAIHVLGNLIERAGVSPAQFSQVVLVLTQILEQLRHVGRIGDRRSGVIEGARVERWIVADLGKNDVEGLRDPMQDEVERLGDAVYRPIIAVGDVAGAIGLLLPEKHMGGGIEIKLAPGAGQFAGLIGHLNDLSLASIHHGISQICGRPLVFPIIHKTVIEKITRGPEFFGVSAGQGTQPLVAIAAPGGFAVVGLAPAVAARREFEINQIGWVGREGKGAALARGVIASFAAIFDGGAGLQEFGPAQCGDMLGRILSADSAAGSGLRPADMASASAKARVRCRTRSSSVRNRTAGSLVLPPRNRSFAVAAL